VEGGGRRVKGGSSLVSNLLLIETLVFGG